MNSYNVGQNAVLNGAIDIVSKSPQLELDSELIERKGAGHPDSICDELASLLSQKYSAFTVKHCNGMVLHHQIDKLMLIGGKTEVSFGGGAFVEPIQIILAGRISRSYLGKELPVKKIINQTLREYFLDKFPMIDFDSMVVVHDFLTSYAGPGTLSVSKGSIANMFNPVEKDKVRGYEDIVANDTSFCVAYEPLSLLEKTIKELEQFLTSAVTRKKYIWLGTDIKIMAYRQGKDIDITSCIPQIAQHVPSHSNYKQNLKLIAEIMLDFLSKNMPVYNIRLSLNTKDKDKTQNVYLTVSGASLSGDIGVVGRGNRPNGLITARHPMSMEGTNGKNPRYYAGFVYAVCAKRIAERIYQTTKKPNIVEIVSQNGGPLLRPWHTRITSEADEAILNQIVESELANIPNITTAFIEGKLLNH